MLTTNSQISLCIHAVWSASLLFALRYYNTCSCYVLNFKTLASLCSSVEWFEFTLVVAHLIQHMMYADIWELVAMETCNFDTVLGYTKVGKVSACLKKVHGLSGLPGHCPWTQWTFTMDSVDSLDNVHGYSGQSPRSAWTKSSETSQTGQCLWIQWTLSMDSVDIVHGLRRQSGHCPWTPWTKSRESRRTGQCPVSPWTDWTLSMDSLDKVQSDLVKKIEL